MKKTSIKKNSYRPPRISRISQINILKQITYQSCKESESSWFSKLLFLWTSPLIHLGYQRTLKPTDLYDIPNSEKIGSIAQKLDEIQNVDKSISLIKMLWSLNKSLILSGFLTKVFGYALEYFGPICLGQILSIISKDEFDATMGFIWTGILLFSCLVKNILTQYSTLYISKIALKVQNALYSKIYEKTLRLSAMGKKVQDSGKILNLINIDIFAIWNFTQMAFFFIVFPFVLTMGIILLLLEISWPGIIGILIAFLGFGFQVLLQKKIFFFKKNMFKYTDKRSKAINEYVTGIKIIKFYGWESMSIKKIAKIRAKEVSLLYKQSIYKSLIDFIAVFFPLINPIIVFVIYIYLFDDFSTSKVYTVITLLNIISDPLRTKAGVLNNFSNFKNAINRIEEFLNSEEKISDYVYIDKSLAKGQIIVENASFSWEADSSNRYKIQEIQEIDSPLNSPLRTQTDKEGDIPLSNPLKTQQNEPITTLFTATLPPIPDFLSNIDFTAEKGKLIAIVGACGSGKSSLAQAILGEMTTTSGMIRFNGKISYVPQSAWLMNATLRDNITFFNRYNETKFKEIIKICELENDLKNMAGNDMTEIGERGLNLSGGQKQRISLARALYSNNDIYIIDDVLSALDDHVGEKIFRNVIRDCLKEKTVIFITHALHYTKEADQIIVLKKGIIKETGTFWELMSDPKSEFRNLNVHQKKQKVEENSPIKLGKEPENKEKEIIEESIIKPNENANEDLEKTIKGCLIRVEEKSIGTIPWRVYKVYTSYGGYFLGLSTIFLYMFTQTCKILNDWWLGMWSSDNYNWSLAGYVCLYIGLALFGSLLVFIRSLMFFNFNIRTAEKFHKNLIKSIMKCPLSWFDVHPIGRIMGRTTKDQDNLDCNIQSTLQFLFFNLFMILGSVILTSIITPYVLIFLFFACFIYYYLMKKYIKSSREIKRIELNSRNPISSIFEETSHGTYIIRAANKEEHFIKNMIEKCNELARAIQNNIYGGIWIGLRTDLIGSFFIGSAAFFGVLSRFLDNMNDPALVALSISAALQISQLITFEIKLVSDTENFMSSAQRILEYIEKNKSERNLDIDKIEIPKKLENWPSVGKITANNIKVKYSINADYVINGISFEINDCEKIGVVGRTGSGKSTLTLALLRILEIFNEPEGEIIIDGQVIGNLDLHLLRRKIVIIPQDPILFSGSLRKNIDPFEEYPDELILEALDKVQLLNQLKEKDKKVTNPLKIKIFEDGCNFSLGQKQLICICRALIRKPKILLMDEATANIDQKTDALIQKMIKTEFNNTTVITIAHRLNTIIHYDKIMVLENGFLIEFDSPINLIEKENGLFANIIKEHGKEFEDKMIFLAKNKELNLDSNVCSRENIDEKLNNFIDNSNLTIDIVEIPSEKNNDNNDNPN